MNQVHQLFELIKKLITILSVTERIEFASFLVPEYEIFSLLLPDLTDSVDNTLSRLVDSNDKLCYEFNDMHFHHQEGGRRVSISEALSRSLKLALHIKELKSLRNLHYVSQQFAENLLLRRDNFAKMEISDKIRCLAKTIEQFAEEIPLFLAKIDDFGLAVENRLCWKEWKYLFKVITAKIARVFGKLRQNQEIMEGFMNEICAIIAKEQFTKSLSELGLIKNPKTLEISPIYDEDSEPDDVHLLERFESLTKSPTLLHSNLSKASLKLLLLPEAEAQDKCDLSFHVFPPKISSAEDSYEEDTQQSSVKPVLIHSHRALIAARCDWFKRALLSGMKESINKRITVHDVEPSSFKIFLQYIYSGLLETKSLSADDLVELLQLSDKYELDCLKRITETALISHIDQESVFLLLTVANQMNAKHLRLAALE